MDFAQPLPLLSLPETFNIKYLKSGDALKQTMTKPLLLAKQRAGLTALKDNRMGSQLLILSVFYNSGGVLTAFDRREEPIFVGCIASLTPQQAAADPVLCPSSRRGQPAPTAAPPNNLLLGSMERD